MNKNTETFYNANIERGILSALVYDAQLIDMIEEEITSELFYIPFHKKVYETICNLQENDKPVSEEFIIVDLKKINSFDEEVFLEILSATPISNINEYIKELQELYARRELHHLSLNIKLEVAKQNSSDDIISNIESSLLSITHERKQQNFFCLNEIFNDVNKHIELMQSKKDSLIGIDTGFTALNAYTSGFNSGDLIILAARPSMGKTSLAINMMLQTSSFGNGVALLSLEMPKDQIALRMLSVVSGIPLATIRGGKMTIEQQKEIANIQKKLTNLSIHIDDSPNLTLQKIKSKIKKLIFKNPDTKLVIIDYLQLIDSNSTKDRHLQISEISRGLKLLARELGISVMALSQLNRSLEGRADKRPMLSDLRESGAIEQDADLIMFIYREDVYKKQEEKQKESELRKKGIDFQSNFKEDLISRAELIIGKQRNGPIGTIELEFVKPNTSFREKNQPQTKVFEFQLA